jgi:hypothetical protein
MSVNRGKRHRLQRLSRYVRLKRFYTEPYEGRDYLRFCDWWLRNLMTVAEEFSGRKRPTAKAG